MSKSVKVQYSVADGEVGAMHLHNAQGSIVAGAPNLFKFDGLFKAQILPPVTKYISPYVKGMQVSIVEKSPTKISTDFGEVHTPWMQMLSLVERKGTFSAVLWRDQQIYDTTDVMHYGPWIQTEFKDCSDIIDFIKKNHCDELNVVNNNLDTLPIETFILANKKHFSFSDIPEALAHVRKLEDGITIEDVHSSLIDQVVSNVPTLSEMFKDYL